MNPKYHNLLELQTELDKNAPPQRRSFYLLCVILTLLLTLMVVLNEGVF